MLRRHVSALGTCLLFGCTTPPPADALADGAPVLTTYSDIMFAAYDDSVRGSVALEAALDPLTEGVATALSLEAAREAWVASRPPYLQTEVSRFYGGPIDDPETGPEGRINAWPLDEAYVDYVAGADGMPIHGGLVNDTTLLPEVTAEGITALHEVGSEQNLSLGYHAIEFLLWGQDLESTGSGERPHTDYVVGDPAGMSQERRRAYLDAVSVLLTEDLTTVRDAWAAGTAGNYRAGFVALSPREGIRLILLGMGSLSGAELAGERLNVAYTTRDQNDEHSCFSDTTLQDQYFDTLGIQNVYLGRYVRTDGTMVSGPSLSDVVRARDPGLDARFRAELEESLDALDAIPAPFDQAIVGDETAPGRVAVLAAINALRRQTATLVEIADLLGIMLNLET
jgi:putative iron-regulated protein